MISPSCWKVSASFCWYWMIAGVIGVPTICTDFTAVSASDRGIPKVFE